MRSWKPRQESGLSGFPCSRELARGRERKTYMGTQVSSGARVFNDLFVSICRLLYKEFLSTMIKIRKLNIQQPLSRIQGISNGHKVRRQSISQERELWLSSFVIRRMFTEGNPRMRFLPNLSPGSSVLLHWFPLSGTDKEQRIFERQKTAYRNHPVKRSLTVLGEVKMDGRVLSQLTSQGV